MHTWIPGLKKPATQNLSAQPKGGTYPPFCRGLHWSYTGLLPANFSRVAVFEPLYDAGPMCSRTGRALHRKRSTPVAGGQFHLKRGIALVALGPSQFTTATWTPSRPAGMTSPSCLAGFATIAVRYASLVSVLRTAREPLQMPRIAGVALQSVELGRSNMPREHCFGSLVPLPG